MGQWLAAETSYAAALDADNGVSPLPCSQLLFEWGVSAMRRGDLDRAEAIFVELDAILPAHVPGRGHRAEVALARGKLDFAMKLVAPLLEINKSNCACQLTSATITGELNMNLLKGKGAVVTGAASGIGKAIATVFIEEGASVLLCDLNAIALENAARELGDRAIGRVTDVSDETSGRRRDRARLGRHLVAGYRGQLRGFRCHCPAD